MNNEAVIYYKNIQIALLNKNNIPLESLDFALDANVVMSLKF